MVGEMKNQEFQKIIALRDIDSIYMKQFLLLDNEIPEVNEIKNGYSNPLILSNIITMRLMQLQEII